MPDDLLATAIEAAGRSKALEYVVQPNRRPSSGGPLWAMKGWPPSATFDQTVTLNTVDERIKCTMIRAGAQSRAGLSEDDPVNHDAQSPYLTFSVIDPDTGRPVPYGERGQVVMNHISRTMFVPNNLERDTTMRVAGPEGQVGDSVSEVKPVETFGSKTVIEGVIRTTTLSQSASCTQGLVVAIDPLDTQPRGDHQHRRSGTGLDEHRSHALRSEVMTPLSKCLAVPGPGRLDEREPHPMTDPAPAFFVQLRLPDTDVARKSYAFAKRATPAFILHHGIRSYVFARAHAARRGLRPGTDYDDELVFVSCILHDIGLSEQGNGDQRFEVDGADTAAAFLRQHGVEERRVAIAWDAIALHTSPGIANRKATEVAMSQAGIATDVIGAGRGELPAGLADQLHALLPRTDLAYALSDAVLAQAMGKPHKANPLTFAGVLLRHHLPYGAYPGWYDLISSAGWGDKPVGVPARRRAETPEEVASLFTEYLETADLDGLVSLYEPNAHFVAAPGLLLVGTVAIREALQRMIDSGARLWLEPRNIRRVDDLALVSNIATVTEATPDAKPIIYTTTEILRRQPDGGWLRILDDPFFG